MALLSRYSAASLSLIMFPLNSQQQSQLKCRHSEAEAEEAGGPGLDLEGGVVGGGENAAATD